MQREQAKVLAMLPRAAAAYLKQVDAFAAGDPRATQKVRLMLKGMIGPIKLAPEPDGSLSATYKQLDVAALVRTAGALPDRWVTVYRRNNPLPMYPE